VDGEVAWETTGKVKYPANCIVPQMLQVALQVSKLQYRMVDQMHNRLAPRAHQRTIVDVFCFFFKKKEIVEGIT
jgi:hypothetical protein